MNFQKILGIFNMKFVNRWNLNDASYLFANGISKRKASTFYILHSGYGFKIIIK